LPTYAYPAPVVAAVIPAMRSSLCTVGQPSTDRSLPVLVSITSSLPVLLAGTNSSPLCAS